MSPITQCNLTNIILGEDAFEQFYIDHPKRNLKDALAPAFDARPEILRAAECVPSSGNERLLLLPGSFELSEYEVPLAAC